MSIYAITTQNAHKIRQLQAPPGPANGTVTGGLATLIAYRCVNSGSGPDNIGHFTALWRCDTLDPDVEQLSEADARRFFDSATQVAEFERPVYVWVKSMVPECEYLLREIAQAPSRAATVGQKGELVFTDANFAEVGWDGRYSLVREATLPSRKRWTEDGKPLPVAVA